MFRTARALPLLLALPAVFAPVFAPAARAQTAAPVPAALIVPLAVPPPSSEHLLFCNKPEKIVVAGTHADAMLRAGQTYTVFFHYRNMTRSRGDLVLALSGTPGKPLRFVARRGFGDPQRDPTLAGRQAMARYLSAADQPYTGAGGAHFSVSVGGRETASGLVTISAKTDARLRIYWRHNKWSVPGASIVTLDSPRRAVAVALSPQNRVSYCRIGLPEIGMDKGFDGTYGMMYSFHVAAPVGSRVRVSFSPRGGKAGLVGSVNGTMRQSEIVGTGQWRGFCEAVMGKDGLRLTTAPFGGVFYPVELQFRLI